jgi:bifunctional non-homologous end joining protein LigD
VTEEEMAELQWLRPAVVAQIRFVEWTADAHLRHAAFLGLRADKPAKSVRRET